MPTTVITGRDLILYHRVQLITMLRQLALHSSIAQQSTFTRPSMARLLSTQTINWTLNVELLADWGVASSLFEAMWTAADTNPNTTLAVSLTAATGAVFACNVLPVFPTVGGAAPGAQTDTWALHSSWNTSRHIQLKSNNGSTR
jgi:hypothetical protein